MWNFGPYVVGVEESLDGTQRYFSPIGGDSSRIGCFDDHLVSGQSGVDLGMLTLEAPALAGLYGSLVDGVGAAVGGARVRAVRLEPVELDDGIGPFVAGSAEWIGQVLPDPKEWVTSDTDGGFVLRGLSRGWYAVEVDADGYLPFFVPGTIRLNEAEPVELAHADDWIDVGQIDVGVGDMWPQSSDNTGSWYDVVPDFRYEYAATPEDDPKLWESLGTFEDMNALSQIDPDDLTTLSTPELLEAVLSYNLLSSSMVYNTLQDGMDAVIGQFNGLEELLSRPDAGQTLLDFYSSLDLDKVMDTDHINTLRYHFLELIIAQDQVLSNLGAEGRVELMAVVAQKSSAKAGLPGRPLNDGEGALIAARIIQLDHPDLLNQVPGLTEAIESGAVDDPSMASLASPLARYATREGADIQPMLAPMSCTAMPTNTVRTPKGTSVPVLKCKSMSAADRATLEKRMKAEYKNAVLVGAATDAYNCHMFAWHANVYTNVYWMNDPAKYMSDGSYALKATVQKRPATIPAAAAKIMTRGYYVGPDSHSVYVMSSTKVHSKWGRGPVMLHAIGHDPYPKTTSIKYYFKK